MALYCFIELLCLISVELIACWIMLNAAEEGKWASILILVVCNEGGKSSYV